MGQYTQVDPIGLAGGNPTLYGYVFNPFFELDIFGLRPTTPAERQAIKDALAKVVNSINSNGVYIFTDASGKPYVGQSQNLYRRLLQHLRDDKLTPENINSINVNSESVGLKGQSLNNIEAETIRANGEIDNTANKRALPRTGDVAKQDGRVISNNSSSNINASNVRCVGS